VGFPESVLTKDEHVEIHLHPHWKALVTPILVLVVVVAAIIASWVLLPTGTGGSIGLIAIAAVGLVLVVWLSLWPWMVWRTTHYVFTNERVIMRHGVFSREGRDIPLNRVNDVSFQHTFFERLLGCGTLTIESAGERGQVVLGEIPHVERVQSQLYELVEADHQSHTFDDGDRDAIVDSVTKATKGGRKGDDD
jgi:uncharacterized membrane protein YdbT with pleckstrin-like domain